MAVAAVAVTMRHIKILVCFRIAKQENLILGIVAAIGAPSAVALTTAVNYGGGQDGLLFFCGKSLVHEGAVQPGAQGACLPSDICIFSVIGLRIQTVAADE